jgi:translation elongation factor EF-Tu-like GTPase
LAFGLYLEGGIANEEKWQARVKELEAKVATAEAKSQEVVTQVVTKYVTRTQVIKERGDTVIQYVDREVVKYDNKCEIPTIVIKAHDAAAKNQPMPVETQPAQQPKTTTEDTKKEPVIQTQEVNAAASNMRLPKRENK